MPGDTRFAPASRFAGATAACRSRGRCSVGVRACTDRALLRGRGEVPYACARLQRTLSTVPGAGGIAAKSHTRLRTALARKFTAPGAVNFQPIAAQPGVVEVCRAGRGEVPRSAAHARHNGSLLRCAERAPRPRGDRCSAGEQYARLRRPAPDLTKQCWSGCCRCLRRQVPGGRGVNSRGSGSLRRAGPICMGRAGSAVVIVRAKSRSITLSATRCAALALGNVRTFAYILSLRCGPRGEGGAPDRLMSPEPVQHDEVLAHTCLWVNSSNPSVSQLEHCAPAPILWPLSRSIR